MDVAAVEPSVHAIAVEFELIGPFVSQRRGLNGARELGCIQEGNAASAAAGVVGRGDLGIRQLRPKNVSGVF